MPKPTVIGDRDIDGKTLEKRVARGHQPVLLLPDETGQEIGQLGGLEEEEGAQLALVVEQASERAQPVASPDSPQLGLFPLRCRVTRRAIAMEKRIQLPNTLPIIIYL